MHKKMIFLNLKKHTTIISKNLLFCCFILLFCGNLLQAKCPPADDKHYFMLDTQASIDSFATLYPNCTEIAKTLVIGTYPPQFGPGESTDITNLGGLSKITTVESLYILNNDNLTSLSDLKNISTQGSLYISYNKSLIDLSGLENLKVIKLTVIDDNEKLVSLKGLENVTSIGSLDIRENPNLTNLNSLKSVTEMGTLSIRDNINLANLNGLENLTLISGSLNIINNDNLNNLNSLVGITNVGFGIGIVNNDNLMSLTGLEGATNIELDVSINYNNSPINLNGLEGLTRVGRNLSITGNNNLIDLNGLNNLTSIEDQLAIEKNNNLTDVSGIKPEGYDNISVLRIGNNSNLSLCNSEGICNYLENSGKSSIINNATNCNSEEEVMARCTVSVITLANLPQIVIYPNPTNGLFNIQGMSKGSYQIYNTSGQIIQQGDMQNDLWIDISREVRAMYFVSVTIDNKTFVRRIFKK